MAAPSSDWLTPDVVSQNIERSRPDDWNDAAPGEIFRRQYARERVYWASQTHKEEVIIFNLSQ